MFRIDLLDKQIMYELDINARISASQLAKKLRKSKETVNFRINRLLQEKYIKGFYTILNTSKLGWFYYKVYLKFKSMTTETEKAVIDYIRQQGHIAYLASTEGYYDCIFLVMAKDSNDMILFLEPFMKLYGEYIKEKEIITLLTTHRLNQRFFYGTEQRNMYYPIEINDYVLDDLDKKILIILSGDAKISLIDLAKKVSSNPKIVKYRISKLEKDKIILGYVSSPNFDKLGLQFIQINIALKDPSYRVKIIEYFNLTNKCLFAMEMLGKYDLAIEIHVENNEELKSMIDNFRNTFVDKYSDYQIFTIIREHLVVWSPLQ